MHKENAVERGDALRHTTLTTPIHDTVELCSLPALDVVGTAQKLVFTPVVGTAARRDVRHAEKKRQRVARKKARKT